MAVATVVCALILVGLAVLEVAIRRGWHPVGAVAGWLSGGRRRMLRTVLYVLCIPGVFLKARDSGMATSTALVLCGGFLAVGVLMLIEVIRERSDRP